ncbi:MAG: phospholipase D-like domain-containing protein [Natrialbaceae archaeon]|nr:phospholipase D-like domain-containing protein [Natrialbaceae archaeon]
MSTCRVGIVLLLLVTVAATPAGATDIACPREAIEGVRSVEQPRIVAVDPNPATAGNVGESVTVAVPPGTNLSGLSLTDGHSTAALPSRTARRSSRALAGFERNRSDDQPPSRRPRGVSSSWPTVGTRSSSGGVRPSSMSLPMGRHRRPSGGSRTGAGELAGTWWPRATCEPPLEVGPGGGTAFVLPDGPEVPLETIESASDRLLVGGYEFTSRAVAEAITEAARRGARVKVLLEGEPVSGHPRGTDGVIGMLQDSGATVRLIGATEGRYRFHHPKYLVADDTVLVTTENWKPAGVGGTSSRGWGVRIKNQQLADGLASVFRADFAGWDTVTAVPDGGPCLRHRPRPSSRYIHPDP